MCITRDDNLRQHHVKPATTTFDNCKKTRQVYLQGWGLGVRGWRWDVRGEGWGVRGERSELFPDLSCTESILFTSLPISYEDMSINSDIPTQSSPPHKCERHVMHRSIYPARAHISRNANPRVLFLLRIFCGAHIFSGRHLNSQRRKLFRKHFIYACLSKTFTSTVLLVSLANLVYSIFKSSKIDLFCHHLCLEIGTHKLSKCPGVGTKKEGKCAAPGNVAF